MIERRSPVPELVEIDLDLLDFDERYQRPPSKARVKTMVAGFSLDLLIPPVVGTRASSGRYLVIDGMHRVAAAREAGQKTILCLVYHSDVEHEAMMFEGSHGVVSGASCGQ